MGSSILFSSKESTNLQVGLPNYRYILFTSHLVFKESCSGVMMSLLLLVSTYYYSVFTNQNFFKLSAPKLLNGLFYLVLDHMARLITSRIFFCILFDLKANEKYSGTYEFKVSTNSLVGSTVPSNWVIPAGF